jgi:hypothetical protein
MDVQTVSRGLRFWRNAIIIDGGGLRQRLDLAQNVFKEKCDAWVEVKYPSWQPAVDCAHIRLMNADSKARCITTIVMQHQASLFYYS